MENQKRHKPEEKYQIIKEFLTSKGALTVSDVCKKHNITTSLFYQWQEQYLQGALDRFKNPPHKKKQEAEVRKLERLDAELKRKDQIIAEVVSENLQLKKNLSE